MALENDVSRETIEKLRHYESLIKKWNPSINLVAKSTVPQIWERHILDSVQVAQFLCELPEHWLDLGSGGGLPGVVVGIIAQELSPNTQVTLIESDQRKATFLRTALRETSCSAKVIAERIEQAPKMSANIISARALAPLADLFEFSERHQAIGAKMIFQKGRSFEAEVKDAQKKWNFEIVAHTSLTDKEARTLEIQGLERVSKV